MTKRVAVHFRTNEKAPPNCYHQACTGFYVSEFEYLHSTNADEVTCGNCKRTKVYANAKTLVTVEPDHVKNRVINLHLTAEPVRHPHIINARSWIGLDRVGGRFDFSGAIVVMGHSVKLDR